MTTRVMIVGCGDVGTATGERLLGDSHNNIEICGVRRQADQLPPTFRKISADFSQRESFIAALAQQPADYVIYSAAATQHDEAGYQQAYVDGLQHTLDALQHWPQAPKQLLFTSSTGVYHQADHSWVDESSATEPKRFSGRIILEAEQLLANSSIATSAVRFSGIYGPGRKRLINSVRSGKGASAPELQQPHPP